MVISTERYKKHLVLVLAIFIVAVLSAPPVSASPDCTYRSPKGLCFYTPNSIQPPFDLLWWKFNPINQINEDTLTTSLKLLSEEDAFNTCGPATLAMVINYFADKTPEKGYRRVDPSEIMWLGYSEFGLYDRRAKDGLLGLTDILALARRYGLDQSYPPSGDTFISFDELYRGVKDGRPAIVGLNYQYLPDGRYVPTGLNTDINHFVVIIGVAHDNYGQEAVWYINTHPGKYLTSDSDVSPEKMPLNDFKQAWGRLDPKEGTIKGYALFIE